MFNHLSGCTANQTRNGRNKKGNQVRHPLMQSQHVHTQKYFLKQLSFFEIHISPLFKLPQPLKLQKYYEIPTIHGTTHLEGAKSPKWSASTVEWNWMIRSVESEFKSMTLSHLINALEHAATMLCSEKKSQTNSNNLSKLV